MTTRCSRLADRVLWEGEGAISIRGLEQQKQQQQQQQHHHALDTNLPPRTVSMTCDSSVRADKDDWSVVHIGQESFRKLCSNKGTSRTRLLYRFRRRPIVEPRSRRLRETELQQNVATNQSQQLPHLLLKWMTTPSQDPRPPAVAKDESLHPDGRPILTTPHHSTRTTRHQVDGTSLLVRQTAKVYNRSSIAKGDCQSIAQSTTEVFVGQSVVRAFHTAKWVRQMSSMTCVGDSFRGRMTHDWDDDNENNNNTNNPPMYRMHIKEYDHEESLDSQRHYVGPCPSLISKLSPSSSVSSGDNINTCATTPSRRSNMKILELNDEAVSRISLDPDSVLRPKVATSSRTVISESTDTLKRSLTDIDSVAMTSDTAASSNEISLRTLPRRQYAAPPPISRLVTATTSTHVIPYQDSINVESVQSDGMIHGSNQDRLSTSNHPDFPLDVNATRTALEEARHNDGEEIDELTSAAMTGPNGDESLEDRLILTPPPPQQPQQFVHVSKKKQGHGGRVLVKQKAKVFNRASVAKDDLSNAESSDESVISESLNDTLRIRPASSITIAGSGTIHDIKDAWEEDAHPNTLQTQKGIDDISDFSVDSQRRCLDPCQDLFPKLSSLSSSISSCDNTCATTPSRRSNVRVLALPNDDSVDEAVSRISLEHGFVSGISSWLPQMPNSLIASKIAAFRTQDSPKSLCTLTDGGRRSKSKLVPVKRSSRTHHMGYYPTSRSISRLASPILLVSSQPFSLEQAATKCES